MSWLGKMEGLTSSIREAAASHADLYYIFPMMIAVAAIMLASKVPALSGVMRRKARIMRYCHDCPFADNFTETCTINADAGEKCGLIDQTAGIKFKAPEVTP